MLIVVAAALGSAAVLAGPPPGLEGVAPLRAATELERRLFDQPRGPHAPAIAARLARIYLAAGRPHDAATVLEAALATAPPGERPALALLAGDVACAAGEPTAEIEAIAAPYLALAPACRPAFALLVRTYVARAEWTAALVAIGRWRAACPADAAGLAALEAAIRGHRERPRPVGWVAAGLSAVLPGSGQWYAGDPGAGLASLAANGAMLGGLATTAWRGDLVGAALLGPFAARYYVGGVLAAGERVRLAEARADERFMARLRADHPGIW